LATELTKQDWPDHFVSIRMRSRLGLILCILIGSFCVYCGQSAMTTLSRGDGGVSGGGSGGANSNGGGGGGVLDGTMGDAVGSAMADPGTCCTAPGRDSPTVLFDDVLAPAPIPSSTACTLTSPVLDVSAYRLIVIHSATCGFAVQFRNGKAGFVVGASGCTASSVPQLLTVDPVLGHDMRINYDGLSSADPDGVTSCSTPKVALTVVGYKNP
jgi:hypothetical protein